MNANAVWEAYMNALLELREYVYGVNKFIIRNHNVTDCLLLEGADGTPVYSTILSATQFTSEMAHEALQWLSHMMHQRMIDPTSSFKIVLLYDAVVAEIEAAVEAADLIKRAMSPLSEDKK